MTVSQQIINLGGTQYESTITVTDVPRGEFLAVVSNTIWDGRSAREVAIELMPLEQAEGGVNTVIAGPFEAPLNEIAVKVTVSRNGTLLAENKTTYR